MDYTKLLNDTSGKKSIVGIIGASKGFGFTVLAQIYTTAHMQLRVVCARNTDLCIEVLKDVGYTDAQIVLCKNIDEINAASKEAVLVVSDYHLVCECGITAMVECTGNTAISSDAAIEALNRGINVYMVSKETDSVCGPLLNQIADKNNAVYCLVNGDQPRNLLDLVSWARILGLEIVCAGKSSEYDFVWDRETGELSYLDGVSEKKMLPEMLDCWYYQGTETLKKRRELLDEYAEVISADLCEMNLVSNATGFVPATPFMDYPIAKPSEIANIFIPEEDGGILKKSGVVDVFYNLRGKDEASFCGGEFIVVKCRNEEMWKLLAGKGHVMSSNGKYCAIYWPYHFMGLETPGSILLGDLMGIGTQPGCRQVSVLAGVADRDLSAGYELKVAGHHHSIDGLIPELLETTGCDALAPFYLLNGSKLLRDVKKGNPVTLEDVDLSGLKTYEYYLEGLKL